MKKAVYGLVSLLALGLVAFQGKDQVINDEFAEARKTKGSFTSIYVSNAIELYISPSTSYSIAVSAPTKEVRNQIKTEVVDGELKIYVEGKGRWWNQKSGKMKVYVGCPPLERIVANGATMVRLMSKMNSAFIKLQLSGASDFKGAIDAETLVVEVSGASDAEFTGGQTKQLKANASGASNLKAYRLFSDNCTVDASGASNVQVHADKSFKIHASGASDVFYQGKGDAVEIKSSGSSTVKRKGSQVTEV